MTADFSYCGRNASDMYPAWTDGGFSPCFLATTSSLTLFSFAFFICGLVAVLPVYRHAAVRQLTAIHKYILLGLTSAAGLLAFVHIIVVSVKHKGAIQYVVVTDILLMLAWFMSYLPIRRAVKQQKQIHLVNLMYGAAAMLFSLLEAASHRSPNFYFEGPQHDGGLVTIFVLRTLVHVLYAAVCFILWARQRDLALLKMFGGPRYAPVGEEESTSLMDEEEGATDEDERAEEGAAKTSAQLDAAQTFQTTGQATSATSTATTPQGTVNQRSGTTFADIRLRFAVIWPFLWPKGNWRLQARVLVCVILLVSGRVINLYVPVSYKRIVDKLTPSDEHTITFPLKEILVYVMLRFLNGGGAGSMGLLNNLRSFLWVAVDCYTSRVSRVNTFEHLHSLSLRWHLSRKTGEVLRMVDRGTESIGSLLSYILFNILPTLADIAVACVYFTTNFGPYFGLTVFITMALYIYSTVVTTEWRTKFRRGMNTRDNQLRQKAVDSLLNFETVKYYNGEEFEKKRYDDTMTEYLVWYWRSQASLNLLNVIQSVVITVGMLIGTLLCGYMVAQGELTVGDFVLFISYIIQLYAPLNFFGTYYRMIQSSLIDMENMFDLLQVKPEVEDSPNSETLQVSTGRHGCSIEFKNVSFAYEPRRPTLKNISFQVAPGQSVALVGSSGSGKSTIMRLLFRFYDVQDGQILVDGKDITKVTQRSLRQIMGVVPQDTVLFNDTIKYNIFYARPDCQEDEIIEAAKAAEIHDSICSFPDGYETVVGERGLKLSGGEKQRVAISRAVLKAPQVILLDEATSALDTETERSIQRSLQRVCENRTSLTIAHRLSTIVGADQILVLEHGEIVERGTHQELLSRGGAYAEMWRRQLEATETEQNI
eukprot:m.136026 g.136026  ORF g.136026 m.136026 type:complete len:877 (-) comp15861_c0_seq2:159-2789(-)